MQNNTMVLDDKQFEPYLDSKTIENKIRQMAKVMDKDLANDEVIFFGILNGAFMFASTLLKKINFTCEVSFVKLVSYQGTSSSGTVKRLVGINEDIQDKTVVILEDIVDSGLTLEHIVNQFAAFQPKNIKIAALLVKPEQYHKKYKIDYTGFEIPDNFVVGYGMDYNGLGRNLNAIYRIIL